ncbi:MAG TPA: AAA family ATPase [Candidatus Paceibacterota bacterium]
MDKLISKKVFIYGVPGSGKTYLSQKIADELNLPLFEADTLRDELRKLTTKEESLFLFLGTSRAFSQFGELNTENVIKGLKAVREALANRVEKEIKNHDEVVMEGAFLDPNLLKGCGRLILVVTSEEEQHRDHFFKHRENSMENVEQFKAARVIQNFLINEAKDLGVEILENEKY